MTIEPIDLDSPDITADRLEGLRELIPEAFSEGKVDFDKLRAALGDAVDGRPERYSFSWAGKRDAIRLLQTPSAATLVPAPEESVNWETTQHLFIEGDNLEVLKLLYKAYFGRVKLIYIDPPYNTGNDFVYPDDFADPLGRYLEITGQKDAAGNLLTSNPETSGRYHSAWLNMMYPRLFMARQLLTEDGAIFISIGEEEVHNLRVLLSEIFGEENVVATIVWQRSKKGDAKLIAQIHEYILVAVKSRNAAIASGVWRKPKQGADIVLAQYEQLRRALNNEHARIADAMQTWFRSLPTGDVRRQHEHYRFSDERGLYFAADFAGPDDGRLSRPRHDILHPVTGKPCKKPRTGWRWDEKRTKEAMAMNPPLIHFGPDETTVPCRKTYLKDTSYEPFSSVFYRDGRAATLEVEKLLGATVMEFPKNTDVLRELLQIIPDTECLVMDFFAGSCPLAQATLELNGEDGGTRRFIMVQLPEPTSSESRARQAGFASIAEIGKQRIRAILTQKLQKPEQQGLISQPHGGLLGFRVFKLSPSALRAWRGTAAPTPDEYVNQLALLSEALREGWRAEDVVWEVAIKEGFPLTSRVAAAAAGGQEVYRVEDPDSGRAFHVCLDDTVSADVAAALGLASGDLLVVRDAAVDDTTAANLALQCRLKTL